MPATRTKVANGQYLCGICRKEFSRSYDRGRHEATHCKKKDRKHGCSYEGCDFRANQKGGIIVHEKSEHKGERVPCGYCAKDFSDPSGASKHRKRFHPGAKKHKQHAPTTVTSSSSPPPFGPGHGSDKSSMTSHKKTERTKQAYHAEPEATQASRSPEHPSVVGPRGQEDQGNGSLANATLSMSGIWDPPGQKWRNPPIFVAPPSHLPVDPEKLFGRNRNDI